MAKQIIARPKNSSLLLINNGQHGTIKLHPNQKWGITVYNKNKLSLSHGCVDLLVEKTFLEERFYIVTEEVEE